MGAINLGNVRCALGKFGGKGVSQVSSLGMFVEIFISLGF